jgi:phage gp46-like protein
MQGDVAIAWDAENSRGDWSLTTLGNVLTAPAIETAVMVSLFTDARARPDDRMVPGDTDRRGWWGNMLDDQPIGSRLWLLRRAKHLPETLKLARDYIAEALAWLKDEGLAVKIDVSTEWQGQSRILARIALHRADGGKAAVTAAWAWRGA